MAAVSPTVVIIEPEYLMRDVFALAVRHMLPAANVVRVPSGEAALAVKDEQPAHLCLIAAELPGISGGER